MTVVFKISNSHKKLIMNTNFHCNPNNEKALDILLYKEGQCILNEDNLQHITNQIDETDQVYIITTIGDRCTGKSFLLNCAIHYFNHHDHHNSSSWPQGHLEYPDNFYTDNSDKQAQHKIQMHSKVLRVENETEVISFILMDSHHVFDLENKQASFKIMEYVLDLFLNISSTIVFTTVNMLEVR